MIRLRRSTAAGTAGCTPPQPIVPARGGRPLLATFSFVGQQPASRPGFLSARSGAGPSPASTQSNRLAHGVSLKLPDGCPRAGAPPPVLRPSSGRGRSARVKKWRCFVRDREACRSRHFQALIRNTPDRGWPRHQNRRGAARARGRQHDDGVHARAQSRSARCEQSCRPTLMSANAVGGAQWRPIKAHGPCGSTREIVDLQEVGRSKVVARCPSLAATARVQCGRSRPITFVIAVVTAW